jgi:glutamine cyclotransferase
MSNAIKVFVVGMIIILIIILIYPISDPDETETFSYKVLATYPHDTEAFTQGLVFEDGYLYEGTGLYGESSLRKVDLESGEVMLSRNLSSKYFGEGITIYNNRIIQLTWKAGVGFVYDQDNFTLLRQFSYPTEGWGITHDGGSLIMSDGSAILHFLDPDTFQETGRIEVYDENGPVINLNELEYINGEIFANVWLTTRIARISPITGEVHGWLELEELLDPEEQDNGANVLNGIAYDNENDRLFVTGKLWPKIFELKLGD